MDLSFSLSLSLQLKKKKEFRFFISFYATQVGFLNLYWAKAPILLKKNLTSHFQTKLSYNIWKGETTKSSSQVYSQIDLTRCEIEARLIEHKAEMLAESRDFILLYGWQQVDTRVH